MMRFRPRSTLARRLTASRRSRTLCAVEWLVDRLRTIPGVVAVALGGSRAVGRHRPDSDWDFGLYYRGSIDTDAIRALGYSGTVTEPGEWGRLVNGGAWLTIDGGRVDLLYRNLDGVEHWLAEAHAVRFERDHVEGYIAGMATYVLAGELALNQVVYGHLPRPEIPPALRRSAPPNWFGSARFSLDVAGAAAAADDVPGAVGLALKALVAAAQGSLANEGEWVLNEKRILARAGLEDAARRLLNTEDTTGLAKLIADLRPLPPAAWPRSASSGATSP